MSGIFFPSIFFFSWLLFKHQHPLLLGRHSLLPRSRIFLFVCLVLFCCFFCSSWVSWLTTRYRLQNREHPYWPPGLNVSVFTLAAYIKEKKKLYVVACFYELGIFTPPSFHISTNNIFSLHLLDLQLSHSRKYCRCCTIYLLLHSFPTCKQRPWHFVYSKSNWGSTWHSSSFYGLRFGVDSYPHCNHQTGNPLPPLAVIWNSVCEVYEHNLYERAVLTESRSHFKQIWPNVWCLCIKPAVHPIFCLMADDSWGWG